MKELLNEISYTAIDTRATQIHRSVSRCILKEMSVASVAGILMDSDRHWSLVHSDTLPSGCTVGDIADSSGEWTAIAEHHDGDFSSYLAFGDYAGHAPLFYAILPGKAVVLSGSFSGVVQGFINLGGHTTLNMGNYLTLITGRARTFETLIASETMANEIHILPPDCALLVENDAASIIDRGQLSPASAVDDYEEALTKAINYSSSTISRALSNNNDAIPLITLTGGVDSRLVFALLNTTDFSRDFRVWTMDPRNKKDPNQRRIFTTDVEISNQIRKSYGLSWMSDWRREKYSASLEETLARHQSYYSNYVFQFYLAKHVQLEIEPILTLRGGGGEILRGSANARITHERYEAYLEEGGKLADVDWAAENYLERSFLTKQLEPVARDYLAQQLSTSDITPLREKLDRYYRAHRNRAHFGHHRVSEDKKDHILQVLSNPYIQRLVDLSDQDFVGSNGIVLDMFKATEPDLLKFPFESPAAHDELYMPTSQPFVYDDRDGWINDFDRIGNNSESYDFRMFAEPGHRGERTRGDAHSDGIRFIRQSFRLIEQLIPAELRRAVELQHQRVMSRLENKQIPVGKFMAIVASTTDIFAPMRLDAARHLFTAFRVGSQSRIGAKGPFYDAAAPYRDLLVEGKNLRPTDNSTQLGP